MKEEKEIIKDILEHFGKHEANLEAESCREKIASRIVEALDKTTTVPDDKPWWP